MAAAASPDAPAKKFEYLDHTADVQLHAWGDTLKEAFEQCAMALYGYMTTDYDRVEMKDSIDVEAEGDDLQQLLFQFLNECLFVFSADSFLIARRVEILKFEIEGSPCRIQARLYGEPFDTRKHPPGTEVKAITYSNMQIYNKTEQHEVFVIIDI